MRGSRSPRRASAAGSRSIPACAGEPSFRKHLPQAWQVYPRVCGGAPASSCPVRLRSGLSPRVRGSQTLPAAQSSNFRSIPACAGEPRSAPTCTPALTVYPRVCGGASLLAFRPELLAGLSPRVRGSRVGLPFHAPARRSIPACAGEPFAVSWLAYSITVYPRVCGGAASISASITSGDGLSPRVRGSPWTETAPAPCRRSIPACAGEPQQWTQSPIPLGVYPRVCGGAPRGGGGGAHEHGLSPRVRGSRPCSAWGSAP